MKEKIVISVGTKKGLFLLTSDRSRRKFEVSGPLLPGSIINAVFVDTRGKKPTVIAGACSPFWGTKVMRSTDLGRTFKDATSSPAFTKEDGRTVKNIWALEPGAGDREIWCGVEPASLFRSADGGDNWEAVPGLNDHPHARTWQPGNGGLCLHTILPTGGTGTRSMHVAISTGGHYRSDDGGRSWTAMNKGIPASFQPDKFPEYGHCVHKIAGHPKAPGRLYAQNHGGDPDVQTGSVLRSDDDGASWQPVTKGLPGDFGFPLVVHPSDPDTAFVMPLDPPTRTSFKGAPAVYRTKNGGGSWKKVTKGFPPKGAHFTVLRDAMATDGKDPAGIYFGTRTGQLWASRNDGDSWSCITSSLPPIYAVRATAVA